MKELARATRSSTSTRPASGATRAAASPRRRDVPAPDFFKVGIAESGNHDNRNYEDDWGERYQGLLVRNGDTDNYAAEANQTHAANLRASCSSFTA
jgi:hypothetical protein